MYSVLRALESDGHDWNRVRAYAPCDIIFTSASRLVICHNYTTIQLVFITHHCTTILSERNPCSTWVNPLFSQRELPVLPEGYSWSSRGKICSPRGITSVLPDGTHWTPRGILLFSQREPLFSQREPSVLPERNPCFPEGITYSTREKLLFSQREIPVLPDGNPLSSKMETLRSPRGKPCSPRGKLLFSQRHNQFSQRETPVFPEGYFRSSRGNPCFPRGNTCFPRGIILFS